MSTIKVTDDQPKFEREDMDQTEIDLDSIKSEDEDYESAPPDYQIFTYPADFTLEVLHHKFEAEDILIPDFQRRLVWTQVQASKLIESFLIGLPVPSVFLYSEQKSQKLFVIDGQQRLKSIFYFFKGYFALDEGTQKSGGEFRLVGLSTRSRFYCKTFEEMHDEDKLKLKNAVLRVFIIRQLDPDDATSMYHIFERLNTGGTLLTNQEIRNCIYHGRFTHFLKEINDLHAWRNILGKDIPNRRGKDIELLVRFFAMRDISTYEDSMKDFLSKFMKKNQDASDPMIMTYREIFERTCDRVVVSLGRKPFHGDRGLNVAVFDAVMIAFSNHLDEVPQDVSDRYKRLIENSEFKKNTRNCTINLSIIKERLHQADTTLFG